MHSPEELPFSERLFQLMMGRIRKYTYSQLKIINKNIGFEIQGEVQLILTPDSPWVLPNTPYLHPISEFPKYWRNSKIWAIWKRWWTSSLLSWRWLFLSTNTRKSFSLVIMSILCNCLEWHMPTQRWRSPLELSWSIWIVELLAMVRILLLFFKTT